MNAKQNPTKDHHYVPVCYIKQFLNSERKQVATLNVENLRSNFTVKLKWYSPRQFCYIEDYYTISDDLKKEFKDFDIYEALHIESKLFQELENGFHHLMELLIKKRAVPVKEAMQLADLLVQMKIRNPYWEQGIAAKSSGWLDRVYPTLEEKFLSDQKYQAYSRELKQFALQKELERTRRSPLISKRMQLYSLIQRNTPGGMSNLRLRRAILESNWVLLTASGIDRFITTDNPGFALDDKCFHNIKLSGYYRFYFPLSPKYCLMLGDGIDSAYLKKRKIKTVSYRKCGDQLVFQINNAQLKNAYRYAIAESDHFLSQIRFLNSL